MNKGSLPHIAALASAQRHRSAAIAGLEGLEGAMADTWKWSRSHGWQNGPPREGAWPDRWAIAGVVRELGDRCFSGRRLPGEPSSFGGSGTMWNRNSLEDVPMFFMFQSSTNHALTGWSMVFSKQFFYIILLQNPNWDRKEMNDRFSFVRLDLLEGMSHVTLVKSHSNLYSTAFIPNSWHVQTNCLIGLCKSYQLDLNTHVLSCFYVLTRLILCGCSPASPFLSVEPRPGDLAVSWPARERWSDQRLWIIYKQNIDYTNIELT